MSGRSQARASTGVEPGAIQPDASAVATFETLALLDWDFVDADTGAGGHDAHPYPAKFPPQLPRQVIRLLSSPGHAVLDPFGGSGTAALEAVAQGRRAYCLDANPVAVLLTRAKMVGLTEEDRQSLAALSQEVKAQKSTIAACDTNACLSLLNRPIIANIDKWFAAISVHELCHLREVVAALAGVHRDVAELAIGQTAAKVSFQDSETRYVSIPREVLQGEAIDTFAKELLKISGRLPARGGGANAAEVFLGDARTREHFLCPDASVDLVVTSPPYPNAYDYHLYHRFRMLWTLADPVALRKVEIGSHLRQQSVQNPIEDYEADMARVMQNLYELLRPGAWCVFVVGDGKYRGEIYSTSDGIGRVGKKLGFNVVGVLNRNLPMHKRSVTSAGRRLNTEQIVFLQKPSTVEVHKPDWPMCKYEEELSRRELEKLEARSGGIEKYAQLTFAKAVTVGQRTLPTHQYSLELSDGSRLKNSTYASHGIHKYKGKFYPQLGRCLINLSCDSDSLVLDPFAGSGTVALEAALMGLEYHGIELSPVGAATARAKVDVMRSPANLLDGATKFLEQSLRDDRSTILWSEFSVGTHEELESWFAPVILGKLSQTLHVVRLLDEAMPNGAIARQLGEVCASDLVRDISHQDPSDLRIRRRRQPLDNAAVGELFMTKWRSAVRKISAAQAVAPFPPGTGEIVLGDSTLGVHWPSEPDGNLRLVDAIVTSPPYAAALPYLDTDRLSIAAVFGHSKKSRVALETSLVGSREINTRERRALQDELASGQLSDALPSSTTLFLQALSDAVLRDASAGFRRQQTPAVLLRYFLAMSRVLALAAERLRPNGDAWFVLGDSKTTIGGELWRIPTTQEIAAIGKHQGLELIESIPISVTRDNMRHARNAITANTLLHFKNR